MVLDRIVLLLLLLECATYQVFYLASGLEFRVSR
jgi:hypothetical protein